MDALGALKETLTENGARRAFVTTRRPLILPPGAQVVLIENFETPFVIIWYMPEKERDQPWLAG